MKGERIISRQAELRIRTKEITSELNISGPTLSRWKNNINEPDDETKIKLATILRTSVAFLMGETDDAELKLNVTTAPLIGEKDTNFVSEAVIYTSDLVELTLYDIPTVVSCEMELAPLQDSKGVGTIFTRIDSFTVYDKKRPPFAVTMPNDSMRGANINKDDDLVVNPAESTENGEPALVIYNGTGLIRWVIKKADGCIELQAANTDYASILIEQEYVNNAFKYRVVGRVVEVITRKKPSHAF